MDEIFFLAVFALVAWNIYLALCLRKTSKKLHALFRGQNATDLEGVLFTEIRHLKKAEQDVAELRQALQSIRKMAKNSIQKAGFIRFNPFKETGGDQSFAVALLDSCDNGVVISSLYTRQGTRVYGKPITKGKSKYPLSREETEALARAGLKQS